MSVTLFCMAHRDPWTRTQTMVDYVAPHLRVHRDQVIGPDGHTRGYDWVETSDQVRVAAVVDNRLLLIEQHHYLTGRSLQLPGGGVDGPESDQEAARRELREETGYRDGTWSPLGYLYPLPGLSPVRVHLWRASDLSAGAADPEPGEEDLRLVRLHLRDAVRAVRDGSIRCAASATLVLNVAANRTSGNPARRTRP